MREMSLTETVLKLLAAVAAIGIIYVCVISGMILGSLALGIFAGIAISFFFARLCWRFAARFALPNASANRDQ